MSHDYTWLELESRALAYWLQTFPEAHAFFKTLHPPFCSRMKPHKRRASRARVRNRQIHKDLLCESRYRRRQAPSFYDTWTLATLELGRAAAEALNAALVTRGTCDIIDECISYPA